MFDRTKQAAVFSGVTLLCVMEVGTTLPKNMSYIPNEGVDMHGDADPGAFKSSNCNTMDIIITLRLFLQIQIDIIAKSTAKKQTGAFWVFFKGVSST